MATQVIVLNGGSSSHEGVRYDLQVDTTHTEALDWARAIAARAR